MEAIRIRLVATTIALAMPALLLAAGTSVAQASSTAMAPCHLENRTYKVLRSKPSYNVWIGTNTYSIWVGGPGSITWTKTRTATSTSGKSSSWTGGGGINWGVVSAKVDHTWGKSTSRSTSKSDTWGYNLVVPNGLTARAMVYKLGWSFGARITDHFRKGCGVLQRTHKGRLWMPYNRNTPAYYCIVRDSYPGDKLIRQCKKH